VNSIFRRFGTLYYIFTGGVSRKNNRDETDREFIQVKDWLKNCLSLTEGERTGRGVPE
jgi:hypothetical protein